MNTIQITIDGGDVLMQTRFRVGDDAEQFVVGGGDKTHFYAYLAVSTGHFLDVYHPVLFIKFHYSTLFQAGRAFPSFLPVFW
jgi:hypothetical protein